MIPRKTHMGRKILLVALLALIVGLAVFAAAKRDTLRLLLNPDGITVHDAAYVERAVRAGEYADLVVQGDPEAGLTLDYLIPDRSVRIHSEFEYGEAVELSGEVYPSQLTINSLSSALKLAEDLLLPYFSKPEIEALEVGLVGSITQNAMNPHIDFSTTMGRYTVTAQGDAVGGGTVRFWITMAQ